MAPFSDAVTSALSGDNDAGTPTPAPAPPAEPAPANATASTPAEQTSAMPVGNQLTPPAATPAPQQLNLQAAQPPEKPGEHWKNLSRAAQAAILAVHAFIPNQVVDGYDTDETGKMTPRVRQLGGMDRVKMMARAALTGLAAGSQVPPQKSGAASIAAGFGAGFTANQQQAQQQDLLQRQQGKEQFEREQKTLMDKAIRASHNASTYSLWQKAMAEANDHDPERQKNMDLMNAANDFISKNPGIAMSVQIATPEEVQSMREADKHSIGVHTFLPIGMTQAKDADGNPLFESDGVTPKQIGQIAVISGGMDGGKIALPQSFVDDLQKYGKAAGIRAPEQYKAGMQLALPTVLSMDKAMNPIKSKEIDGWKTAKDVIRKDGTHAQQNEITGEVRDYPEGMQPNVKNEPAESAATVNEKNAQAEKARQDANQQKLLNPAGSESLSGEDYLKTLPLPQQQVLKAVAEGRETRSPRQLQDKNGNPTPFAVALHRAYPDFDDKNAAAYGGLVKDFKTGPTSRTLTSYGTAINHARALYDNTGPKSYIPGTDEYKRYNQDITYVATEVAKALNPTGVATESAIKEQEDALRSLTNRKAAIENAEHILSGKMSEVKQRWANGQVRPSYQPPMPGLSKEALDNAEYIRNQGKYLVTDPNGKAHTFPDQASADKFKKLAGIE